MPMSEYMQRLRARVGNELLEVPSASIALFDEQRRVLLVRHSEGGVWVLPGGAIEPEELPADAAVREMWEETGLHVRPRRLLCVAGGPECVVRYGNGDQCSYLIVVFEADLIGGTAKPDGEEVLELRWCTTDEARAMNLSRWLVGAFDHVFSTGAAPGFREPTWSPPT